MNGYELVRLQPNQLKKTGDTMTGDLKMSANIVPTTNNARDLGSSSLAFRKVYGSATSADKLTTARGFSINGVRKAFNGEGDVIWTLAEIGAAATNHNQASNTITAMTGYTKGSSSSAIASSDTLNAAIGKLENKVDSKANSTHTHNYAGSATSGGAATSALTCTGNSATATKLQTAKSFSINGASKNFDGTSNISWTLGEIGASPTNHTHNYLSGQYQAGNAGYLKLSNGDIEYWVKGVVNGGTNETAHFTFSLPSGLFKSIHNIIVTISNATNVYGVVARDSTTSIEVHVRATVHGGGLGVGLTGIYLRVRGV